MRPDSVPEQLGKIRLFVTGQLTNILNLLKFDVQKAKLEMEKYVTVVRIPQNGSGKSGCYIAEGEWNLVGGYYLETNVPIGRRIRIGCGGKI